MEPRVQFKLKEVGKFVGARCVGWVVMFKKIAVTVSAVALLMLAVALAPGVPTVLARVGATTAINDAKLNEPLAQQSCEAFENWFLDPSCRQPHVKKAARTKKHLAHN
jgi:hypothetical protein